ncbi:MAG: NADH-quinone oxidoreductase subunit I [Candidatus Omnitrophica bacterium]|nr:NADH-quinone oxidoreductase subunit I [Candidatus Omnitrophota bacterium]
MKSIKFFFSAILNLLKGMKVTIGYLFRPAITLQYPDEKPALAERFRGMLFNDVPRCISCEACVRVCPAKCITLNAEKGETGRRKLMSYIVNFHSCMYCGLCTEVCPVKCLTMSKDYQTTFYKREDLLREYVSNENIYSRH